MNIKDFKIEIKKIDKKRKIVIINLTISNTLTIRGFLARPSKYSLRNGLQWWITPPSSQNRSGAWFWWVKFLDKELWEELECKIAEEVENIAPFSKEEFSQEDLKK